MTGLELQRPTAFDAVLYADERRRTAGVDGVEIQGPRASHLP